MWAGTQSSGTGTLMSSGITSSSSFFLWAGRGSERWDGGAEAGEQLDEGQSLSDRSRAV